MVNDDVRQTQQPEEPRRPWPDPTPEMLASPEFERVWQAIKRWDINVPDVYVGYMGATGNHVRAILDALAPPMKGLDDPNATVLVFKGDETDAELDAVEKVLEDELGYRASVVDKS